MATERENCGTGIKIQKLRILIILWGISLDEPTKRGARTKGNDKSNLRSRSTTKLCKRPSVPTRRPRRGAHRLLGLHGCAFLPDDPDAAPIGCSISTAVPTRRSRRPRSPRLCVPTRRSRATCTAVDGLAVGVGLIRSRIHTAAVAGVPVLPRRAMRALAVLEVHATLLGSAVWISTS